LSVKTIARNISEELFAKIGFKPNGKDLTHPDFIKYGVQSRDVFGIE
jgi:hypothetical protein